MSVAGPFHCFVQAVNILSKELQISKDPEISKDLEISSESRK
jgi:hypothetical protein